MGEETPAAAAAAAEWDCQAPAGSDGAAQAVGSSTAAHKAGLAGLAGQQVCLQARTPVYRGYRATADTLAELIEVGALTMGLLLLSCWSCCSLFL
jgi:hypothetical protein